MKNKDLKNLVDNAVALHREIADKSDQLKRLKILLIQEARLQPEFLSSTESGGKRWTAEENAGCIARVNFPVPGIVAEIESGEELHGKIESLAGDKFRQLFRAVKVFQPVEQFRARVAALLPSGKARSLIELCENPIAPRVSFEVSKSPEGATEAAC